MRNKIKYQLSELFVEWANENVKEFFELPKSGSNRQYFRIISKNKQAIGVFNPNKDENNAFISFAKTFLKNGLKVPEIYSFNKSNDIYLIEDLGDISLFSLLQKKPSPDRYDENILNFYKKSIRELIKFQITSATDIDYSLCYPRANLDKQSFLWDLNYFKYYFLKPSNIQFDEQKLENDFNLLTEFLEKADSNYFVFRDFQSRNILIKNDEPYFIDFQGGRKGALQYDLVSLLYQVRAKIPEKIKQKLLEYYLRELKKHLPANVANFIKFYEGFKLIRLLQVLGAYGFRGKIERKSHFLKSIPHAIESLDFLLKNTKLEINLPELFKSLKMLVEKEKNIPTKQKQGLTVSINSFSYKKGIPLDDSGNGGGFVFDCRALPNPGRYEEYKHLSGKDKKVIEFLEKETEVDDFFKNCFLLINQSVEKYLQRGFKSLAVNFGCTGGQHRSVFGAEALSKHLSEKFKTLNIIVKHKEKENWNDGGQKLET
ncbi:MAG: phosphotransferase [Bacteroidales bacterium]|nr:phosphotransferase [Bacteroidales bacterium]